MGDGVAATPGAMHAAATALRATQDTLANISDSIGNPLYPGTQSDFGDFGVPEQYLAFCQAWHDQAEVTGGAMGQGADGIDKAADRYQATDHKSATSIGHPVGAG